MKEILKLISKMGNMKRVQKNDSYVVDIDNRCHSTTGRYLSKKLCELFKSEIEKQYHCQI